MTTPSRCRIEVTRTPRTSGVPVDGTYFEVAEPLTASGTGTSTDPYVIGLALSADSGNTATLGTDGGLYVPDSSSYWLNVLDYGATGDGVTDDYPALQAAIDDLPASGGTVLVPVETYRISQSLVVRPNLVLRGVGDGSTVIYVSDPDADAIIGTDITRLTVEDITIKGPGGVGTGNGINLTRDVNDATVSLAFNRITVQDFGGSGFVLSNPILSTFSAVTSVGHGNHGFEISGVEGGAAGTSCTFTSCFANSCTNAGYRLDTMAYCAFTGCATDHCGTGYEIVGIGSQGISFNGCGCEAPVNRGTGYDGYSWKIDGAIGIGLYSPWSYQNPNVAVWVTGEARAVSIFGFAENTPTADAVNSIVVDDGCVATVSDMSNESPVKLGGLTNITNDGGGGTVATGFVYGADAAYYEGNVSTTAAPTSAEHLTRKDYVDAQVTALTARLSKLEES